MSGRQERERGRERELAGEHPWTDKGQLALCAVFLALWISDSFLWRYSVSLADRIALPWRLAAGLGILAASAFLVLKAHQALFDPPDGAPALRSKGVFRIVRHPMYVGTWLLSLGLAVTTCSLSAAAVSVAILVFFLVVARHEERLLIAKLGEEYRRCQARVPMFFPLPLPGKRQTYQAEPGAAGITSTSAMARRSSRSPLRRKRR